MNQKTVAPKSGVSRRTFLVGAGATTALIGTGAVSTRLKFSEASSTNDDVVVVVFNRGGMDALNVVAPYRMDSYRALRPNLRVRGPEEYSDPTGRAGLPLETGGNVATFPLSGTFAFPPGMEAIHAGPWSEGKLAVVHAVGLPASASATRSHTTAVRFWQAGAADMRATGFLNRWLQARPTTSPLTGVARGPHLPHILQGEHPSASMMSVPRFGPWRFAWRDRAPQGLRALYPAGTGDHFTQAGSEVLEAMEVLGSLPEDPGPQNGAVYPANVEFGFHLREVARLIRADAGLRSVVVTQTGWDTHEAQGRPDGGVSGLRRRVTQMSDGLAAFYRDLGPLMDRVTVVVVSEFGRTIAENSSGGTDHGRGGAMFVMGNRVRGGVHGPFPDEIAHGPEGDLAVLTDYRTVVNEVLAKSGGVDTGYVFPGLVQTAPLGIMD